MADAADRHKRAAYGVLDVCDAEQWRTVLRGFCGGSGLDVLVNNAGALASGPFVGMDPATH